MTTIKINEISHEKRESTNQERPTTSTVNKMKEGMVKFFKRSGQKEREHEQNEYEKNEKQFMEIFSELSLKQQLLLEKLLDGYIDDYDYPDSSFLHNFELALKNGKEIGEKEQKILNFVKNKKIIKYKRSDESIWVLKKMNEIIEESKKQYSEEDIKTITSEVKDITALQPSQISEAFLKDML